MRILANVTSSLMDDYNAILDKLVRDMDGDTYFSVTLFDDGMLDNIDMSDYDLFVNLFDDSEDIIDRYQRIYDFAKQNNLLYNVISYYRAREFYTSERVYYIKKDVSHERRHRYIDYDNIFDVIFDLLIHASLYFGANISVRSGMLAYKNYKVIDLGKVTALSKNPLLKKYYNDMCTAHQDEMEHAHIGIVDDRRNLLDIDEIHEYMDRLYSEYNTYLSYYISLYREVICAFNNSSIAVLDYLYVKEYFKTGHLTSIVSCFRRNCYLTLFAEGSVPFVDAMNILKLVVYSMGFAADSNQFVAEILEQVLSEGKRVELKFGREQFFHYHEHDFAHAIGKRDDDFSMLIGYVDMVNNGTLEPDIANLYHAYIALSDYYMCQSDTDKAIEYGLLAFERVTKPIDMVNVCKRLYELYSLNADYDNVKKYVAIILDNIDLMDHGYFNDYLRIASDLMNGESNDDKISAWIDEVRIKAEKSDYIDKELKYSLYVKYLSNIDEPFDKDVRIRDLHALIDSMVEDYYIRPVAMYINIYNALISLAQVYEMVGDETNATSTYERAYTYVTTIEEVGDIDEEVNFIQYRIADIDIKGESSKSYRTLVKAEKRTYSYILRTKKYLDFYKEIIRAIIDRIFDDGKTKLGTIVSKSYLSRLITASALNNEYLKDLYNYCQFMSETFGRCNIPRQQIMYAKLSEKYKATCKNNNIYID